MKVRIETVDFGGALNVYFYEETPTGIFVFYTGQDENGTVFWRREQVPEGVVLPAPTLQMNQSMLEALREALYPMKVKADEELVRRLKLEESRVDILIKSSIAIAERRL